MACVFSVAPIKALCSERYEEWSQKFGPLGLKCKELTGDTEFDDYYALQEVNIVMTTPVSDTYLVAQFVQTYQQLFQKKKMVVQIFWAVQFSKNFTFF